MEEKDLTHFCENISAWLMMGARIISWPCLAVTRKIYIYLLSPWSSVASNSNAPPLEVLDAKAGRCCPPVAVVRRINGGRDSVLLRR